MSDNVNRRKSQRWVSVSKGNYDGQEWDSSDDDMDSFGDHSAHSERNEIIQKLPPLPKLGKNKSTEKITENSLDTQITEDQEDQIQIQSPSSGRVSEDYTANNTSEPESNFWLGTRSVASGFEYSDSEEECRVPKTGYFASMNLQPEPIPTSEPGKEEKIGDQHQQSQDAQVSTPVAASGSSERSSTSKSDLKSEPEAPIKLSPDDGEHPTVSQHIPEIEELKDVSSPSPSVNNETSDDDKLQESVLVKAVSEVFPEVSEAAHNSTAAHQAQRSSSLFNQSTKSLDESSSSSSEHGKASSQKQRPVKPIITSASTAATEATPEKRKGTKSSIISSDEYEDNASFFNQYGNNSIQSSPADGLDRSPITAQNSSPLKLRYTSKTELHHTDDESNLTDGDKSFKFKNRNRESILDSSSDEFGVDYDNDDDEKDDGKDDGGSDDETDGESVMKMPKSGYYTQIMNEYLVNDTNSKETDSVGGNGDDDDDDDDTESDAVSTETGSITKSIQASRDGSARGSRNSQETFNEAGNTEEGPVDDNNSLGSNKDSRNLQSRQSINLGKWQPDTDATRADFLGGAASKVPDGYVIDRDGQVVDLNPSSMRNARAVSMYTEAESAWNAFPSSAGAGNGDVDTIYDTKTIYDNQTIYNVPGVATNQTSLPPLPQDISVIDFAPTNTITDSDSILKDLNGEKRQHSSYLKENFSVHAPDSKEIAQLDKKTIPGLDMDALLQAKARTHSAKIKELETYSSDLDSYESGLQTWINYALKSSTSDRDYIFHDYKVNKHVKDAYAQADELGKKMTVSNTVANVNQNVSHLKRKVFSHSMKEKSKGLFSSIGKKKV
ncbi:LAME_0C01178g1_1 [Lachancea meyersii CBS 8951]|uniref:LAME_0C01178g1_1 n=1 Tax=Lachancea meyersii CBS 8951 TaxID=1266667 RepID=A0A1G4IYW3_9SACH|nr:LAME_0C01178g1_1 [Lachancea meyersii CBS 8951]